jgi:hypothetical protein
MIGKKAGLAPAFLFLQSFALTLMMHEIHEIVTIGNTK